MPRYIKKDSELGYIEDAAEIEYLKFNNMRHSVLGCMLGDFDDQGRYVVNELIAKELIEMRKYIVETLDNVSICLSELKLDKQISFAVTFEADKATLSLIEKLNYEGNFRINSGSYSNINEYVLDQVETSGLVDKTIIYRRWNIQESGGSVLDVFNMDEETLAQFAGIVNRFKYLIKANQILLEKEDEIEAVEAEYMIGMLDLVARFPKLKAAVDSRIRQELRDKKSAICVDRPNFAKTMNELITQSIETNMSLLTDEERKEFEVGQHIVFNSYNIKMESVVDVRRDVENNNGDHYTRLRIDTKGAEHLGSISELASAFVKVKQQRESHARSEAVRSHDNSIPQYKPNSDHGTIRERIGAYLNARLGIDIREHLFKPIENVAQEETTVKSTTKESSPGPVKKQENKKAADKKKAKAPDKKKTDGKPKGSDNKKPVDKKKITKTKVKAKNLVFGAAARRQRVESVDDDSINVIPDSNRGIVEERKKITQKKVADIDVDRNEDVITQRRDGFIDLNKTLNNTIGQSKDEDINVTARNVRIDIDEKIVMHSEWEETTQSM